MLPLQTSRVLNRLVLNVALPALVLRAVHGLVFSWGLCVAATLFWVVFLGAWGVFSAWGRRGLPIGSAAALTLTAGLGNTAFIGLPVVEGILGSHAIGTAVVLDQVGSFVALATLAQSVIAGAQALPPTVGERLGRILRFPPFIALVAGIALRQVTFPVWVLTPLGRMADMVTPLALLSVGFQWEVRAIREHGLRLWVGLGYKLVAAPALVASLLWIFHQRGLVWHVATLLAATGPMVTAGMLASEHELDPPLASAMVGVGTILGFFTLAGWAWFVGRVPLR